MRRAAKEWQRSSELPPVDVVVDNVGQNYGPAIEYYKRLRENILQQFFGTSDEIILNQASEQIVNSIIESLSDDQLDLYRDLVFKNFPDKAVNIIVAALEQKPVQPFIDQAKKEYESIADKESEEGKKQVTKLLNQVVNELNKTKNLMDAFSRLAKKHLGNDNFNAVDFTDIKSQLPALQRSIIKQYFEGKTLKGSSNAILIGAYYREAIVAKALADYFASRKLSNVTAKQVGSIKVDGKDTATDVLFGEIIGKNLSGLLEQMSGQLDLSTPLEAIGIQVKSSSLPERIGYSDKYHGKRDSSGLLKKYRNSSTAFKIGQREGLYQGFNERDSTYWWRKGLIYNSKYENILASLGPGNVMWVTGSEAMWTDQFIQNFLKARFRLNFDYTLNKNNDAYKASSQIILAYHNSNLKSANIPKS